MEGCGRSGGRGHVEGWVDVDPHGSGLGARYDDGSTIVVEVLALYAGGEGSSMPTGSFLTPKNGGLPVALSLRETLALFCVPEDDPLVTDAACEQLAVE